MAKLTSLETMLIRHEGFRARPYDDLTGEEIRDRNVTIGVGRNLSSKGLTEEEILYLLKHDIEDANQDIQALLGRSVVDGLSATRWAVLVDMAFNLGRNRLGGFKQMLAAIRAGDYNRAAMEMLDSAWAKQVGDYGPEAKRGRVGRAWELAYMMRSNEWYLEEGEADETES